VLGDAASQAISKVFNLLLAAIAVTFVHQGLLAAIRR